MKPTALNQILRRWVTAISITENTTKMLSPYNGSWEGFIKCCEAAKVEHDQAQFCHLALLKFIQMCSFLTFNGDKDWTEEKHGHWIASLIITQNADKYDMTADGCRQCQEDLVMNHPAAVACWIEFTKRVLKS